MVALGVVTKILNKYKTCSVENCPDPVQARDLCSSHYARWLRCGDPLGGGPFRRRTPSRIPNRDKTCTVEDCPDPVLASGWCNKHYLCNQNHGDPTWVAPVKPPRLCSVETCPNKHVGRGYCQGHLTLWRKYGDPLGGGPSRPRRKMTDVDRFWSRVTKSDDCWEWDHSPINGLRPTFSHAKTSGKRQAASTCVQYAWDLAGGEPLAGRHIWLTCENSLCVRFEHMEAVTWRERCRRLAAKITECPQHHPYDERNTGIAPDGSRYCRICNSARHHVRRARMLDGDLIYINDIFDRDGGICQLCHEPVDPELVWPDPGSRSMDHIVPISPRDPTVAPGAHTLDNVQLAHSFCNCSKNNRSDLPGKSLAAA